MRKPTFAVFLTSVLGASLLLAGCGDRQAPADAAQAPAADAGGAAAPADDAGSEAAAPARKLTRERIAEIRESGRTGLWSDVAELCAGEHARAMIGWNVDASGVDAVAVYLVGKTGNEKLFAQGGPVGEKATGAWLRPGMAFKARAKDDARELASLEIAGKQDCAAG